jgi:hypothetical protein
MSGIEMFCLGAALVGTVALAFATIALMAY